MISTAEEFILKNTSLWTMAGNKQKVAQAMIEFAKLHVEAALKAASEVDLEDDINYESGNIYYYQNITGILKAYPLENIK